MTERHYPSFSDPAKCACGSPMEGHPPRVAAVIGLACPFCGQDGFDKIWLKRHLWRGTCDAFNTTDN